MFPFIQLLTSPSLQSEGGTVPTITFPTASPVQVPSGRLAAFTGRSSDDAASRTWAITGGADAALFTVVASTGRVSFVSPVTYIDPAEGQRIVTRAGDVVITRE